VSIGYSFSLSKVIYSTIYWLKLIDLGGQGSSTLTWHMMRATATAAWRRCSSPSPRKTRANRRTSPSGRLSPSWTKVRVAPVEYQGFRIPIRILDGLTVLNPGLGMRIHLSVAMEFPKMYWYFL
jgi:hypothetical protein